MNTTSKITKGIHPQPFLEIPYDLLELLLKASPQLIIMFNPKFPFFTWLIFIQSFKCECLYMWEHLWHKHHYIYINFDTWFRPLLIKSHILYASHNHVCHIGILSSLLTLISTFNNYKITFSLTSHSKPSWTNS